MTGNQAFAVLLKKLKAVASGIKSISVGADNKSLVFVCNDPSSTTLTVNLPNPINDPNLINKITLDTTTNKLLFDGNPICKCDFTDDQLALLKKFTVNATDGSLYYNGTPVAMLTQDERDASSDLSNNFVFNKDTSGNLLSVEVNGAVISQTTDPVTGDTAVKIGDVIVSGKETVTTSSTITDGNGNPVTETTTTVKTPTDTEQTKTTDSIDSATGNSVNVVETIKGGSNGVNVGSASGTKTTTISDSTGVVISSETEDVSYTNGIQDQWMTQEEVNNIIDGFGWSM